MRESWTASLLNVWKRIKPDQTNSDQPAFGMLLCASKEAEVVEYALSRTLSRALIAEYQTQLARQETASGQTP
jgi:YhcG PDDEXK nuclease domain